MIRKINAFTLLELLIASSIFIIVIISIYSAFQTGLFGYRNIEKNIEIDQTARQILDRINLELRNSFSYSKTESKFMGEKNKISFLTLIDTYTQSKVTEDFALVSYLFENKKVMRLCRLNAESLNDKLQDYEEMADNINTIDFTYITFNAGGEKKEKDNWDDLVNLPTAIKVKLVIKDEKTNTEKIFERTIFLP